MTKLTLRQQRNLILKASRYRSGSDSCNSLYMGGLALARLAHLLGGAYGADSLSKLIARATEAQINSALKHCKTYIDYMEKHPRKTCSCCGALINPKTGNAV